MADYARVCINIAELEQSYDYSIPESLKGKITQGSFVLVPVMHQTAQGIVVMLVDEPEVMEVKPITALLDEAPVVTSAQIKLAQWLAEENLETLPACMDLMLPPELSQHVDSLYTHNPSDINPTSLTPLQQRVLQELNKRGELRGRQLDKVFSHVDWRPAVRALIKMGCIRSQPFLPSINIHPRTVRTASLTVPPQEIETKFAQLSKNDTPAMQRRRKILELLEYEALPLNASWVYAETGSSLADLHWLADRGWVALGETEIWRDPLANLAPGTSNPPELIPDQQQVWQTVQAQIRSGAASRPDLLIGVTGSGKTEIYLRAVEETLAQGKQAVILVPEISLTPQTVRRFYSRFPGQVGLIHSKLSPGERYDTWRRIRSGDLKVIVGARSALFAPYPNLGLIVLDECHDTSYHQSDTRPNYHTLDAAVRYAEITQSVLLLGSATPDVELQYRAEHNQWTLLRLPNRILAHRGIVDREGKSTDTALPLTLPLPPVTVVDMRQELQAGNRSSLSRALSTALQDVLDKKQQAILFLNRRGSASYVFCRTCGETLRCPRCETPFTYHASETALICHHCNYQRKMPKLCPHCQSPQIRQFGLGTESLEKMVVDQFPSANVLRWDAETSRYKGAHDIILDHFLQHRADILIGTQMLAKGLDIPQVTLVGAVLADISLNLPDYRSAERTFQLLTQVAGRAGRGPLGGKVIFQTFHPEHYAIQAASKHDLAGFTQQELAYRRQSGYPPFSKLIRVEFRSRMLEAARSAAESSAALFQSWIDSEGLNSTSLIGPVPCFYNRLNGIHRWQVIIRGPDPRRLFTERAAASWQPRGVEIKVTVDPASLL